MNSGICVFFQAMEFVTGPSKDHGLVPWFVYMALLNPVNQESCFPMAHLSGVGRLVKNLVKYLIVYIIYYIYLYIIYIYVCVMYLYIYVYIHP